jgi:hypothetical protein
MPARTGRKGAQLPKQCANMTEEETKQLIAASMDFARHSVMWGLIRSEALSTGNGWDYELFAAISPEEVDSVYASLQAGNVGRSLGDTAVRSKTTSEKAVRSVSDALPCHNSSRTVRFAEPLFPIYLSI